MTVILGMALIIWVAIFLLSAVICDERPRAHAPYDPFTNPYPEPTNLRDQHWFAKKQLELSATQEMSRIADAG